MKILSLIFFTIPVMKKLLFLFLALLLPVLIFLFLRSFGKNEFNVPVLFADSVSAPVACKQYTYKVPYLIPDSVLQKIAWNPQDSLTIVVFEDNQTEKRHERNIHVGRVFAEFKTEPLQVIRLHNNQTKIDLKQARLTNVSLLEGDFKTLHDCIFLLIPDNDAVIIDRNKRIRGQYNLTEREDADRMIMQEMNILFKRY